MLGQVELRMVILETHATPGAKWESVGGEHDGRLQMKVSARAAQGSAGQRRAGKGREGQRRAGKGRAKNAIARSLAKALRLPKSAVTLRSGQTSRVKRVAVDSDSDAIQTRRKQLLDVDCSFFSPQERTKSQVVEFYAIQSLGVMALRR